MCHIRFCAYPNLLHIQIIVKKTKKENTEKKKQQYRLGTNVWVRGFNAGLLARSQFASGRSCDRATRPMFSVVFLGPRANAELVPKFHVALHASHKALPMLSLKISPCTNVTLTLDLMNYTITTQKRGERNRRSTVLLQVDLRNVRPK
jgi:hypothetical protein